MKKLLFILLLATLAGSCKKAEIEIEKTATILTIHSSLRNNPNPPHCTVYLWDASENKLLNSISLLDGLKFGKIKDVDGREIKALAML